MRCSWARVTELGGVGEYGGGLLSVSGSLMGGPLWYGTKEEPMWAEKEAGRRDELFDQLQPPERSCEAQWLEDR